VGDAYLTGRTTGEFPGATQAGQFDAFTAALTRSGGIDAVRQSGDERPQHPKRIALSGKRLLLAGWDDIFVPTNYLAEVENWFAAELSADDARCFFAFRRVARGVERLVTADGSH
jgi:hypothetical protein